MDDHPEESEGSRLSTDRETIRHWADEHAAMPVQHREESDRYRIVSESEVTDDHETVDWDDFFARLDDDDHVVIYHGAETSEPFEITHREDALTRSSVDREDLKDRLLEGETVTTEVTETTVVESVVVEEATIESELVGTEVIDESVIDVELTMRECTNCTLHEEGTADNRDWFDQDRYLDSIARTESEPMEAEMGAIESTAAVPYSAELDVEETWAVTREFTERFTVESRVADTDVVETDTVEDRDIDIEGLQRTIAESDLLDINMSPENVLVQCDIETEFSDDDRIHTHFTREHVVEDEVVDRKRLHADVTGGELLTMETVHSEEVVTEDAGTMSGDTTEAGVSGAAEDVGEPIEAEPAEGAGHVTLSDDEIGKTVVDAADEELGMVTGVDDSGNRIYVDAHPGITERIKATLEWGDVDEDDVPVEANQIQHITDDRIQLKEAEHL
ncbi:hypothetical protein OB919_00920 [Halobacteria archaeon AArc-curdl1]|uniref:Uncharacterized protein n=1 Tax=Natronosalvus hydrolyticus TaxID=2979988 RepID=A0AAP3E5B2_9EURY|nr:hypothetical protein [Halobacteria archaeon AArc-curdl1]